MKFTWNIDKNKILQIERNISFEQVLQSIQSEGLLDVIKHPLKDNQIIFIVKMFDYVYAVPCVESKEGYFLKTIYPSRKLTKMYGGENG